MTDPGPHDLPTSLTVTDADIVTRLGRTRAAALTRLPTSLPNPPVPHIPADPTPDAEVDALLDALLAAVDHISFEPVNPQLTPGPSLPVAVASHRLALLAVREVVTEAGEHTFTRVLPRSSRDWMATSLDAWAARAASPLVVLAVRGYDAAGMTFLDHDGSGWAVRPPDAPGPVAGGGLTAAQVVTSLLPPLAEPLPRGD